MTVERLDPDLVEMTGPPGSKERFIESDFLIRSGMCPNGHGLMQLGGFGQECLICRFTCNKMPELDPQ